MKHLLLSCIILFAAFTVNAQNATGKKSPAKAKADTQKKVATPVKTPAAPAIIYDKAEIKFDTTTHDFKEVMEGKDAVYIFTFYNIGKEPLTISDARPSCSCTVSDYTKEPVMPGKSGYITVKYGTSGRIGAFTKTVTVSSNSTISPTVVLTISGNVVAAPQETH